MFNQHLKFSLSFMLYTESDEVMSLQPFLVGQDLSLYHAAATLKLFPGRQLTRKPWKGEWAKF